MCRSLAKSFIHYRHGKGVESGIWIMKPTERSESDEDIVRPEGNQPEARNPLERERSKD